MSIALGPKPPVESARNRSPMSGVQRVEVSVSSRYENIELVQVVAEQMCSLGGATEDGAHWIGMAVREAVANAIKHGNRLDLAKRVNATFEMVGGRLRVTISDQGEGFIPDEVADPLDPANLLKTSGRGLFYMETFMDEVRYEFAESGGTTIEMSKVLDLEAAEAGGSGENERSFEQ